MLEFIDRGSNGFLSNLSLTIAAYENLFIKQTELVGMTPEYNNALSSFIVSAICYIK